MDAMASVVVVVVVVVILVPYAFRLLDYVAKRYKYSNDDCEGGKSADDKSKVYDFLLGCLWLHGISIPLCHVYKGISEPSTKNKPTIFSPFTSDRYGDD
jgi:hypothetical protein